MGLGWGGCTGKSKRERREERERIAWDGMAWDRVLERGVFLLGGQLG